MLLRRSHLTVTTKIEAQSLSICEGIRVSLTNSSSSNGPRQFRMINRGIGAPVNQREVKRLPRYSQGKVIAVSICA
jgi:hypothetical protein